MALIVAAILTTLSVAADTAAPDDDTGAVTVDPGQITAWIDGLRSNSMGHQHAATLGLIHAGAPAVPALVGLLSDPDPELRTRAASVVARIGPAARDASDALAAALDDESEPAARRAALALAAVDPDRAVRELTGDLTGGRRRSLAPYGVGALGADAAPLLQRLLGDASPQVRSVAAQTVRYIRRPACDLVPELVAALADDDPAVRSQAAAGLACMHERSAEAVPSLIQTVGDPSPQVRKEALTALGNSGVISEEVVSVLSGGLGDPDSSIRLMAVWALSSAADEPHVELHGGAAVKALIGCLDDEDTLVRQTALHRIAEFGEHAAAAVPQVAAALTDPEPGVRRAAVSTLQDLGPTALAAVPALEAAMREPVAAGECFEALAAITGRPERYVDGLLDAVWEADVVSLGYGVLALGAAGAEGRATVPDLTALLEEQRVRNMIPFLHLALLRGLGDIGPAASSAIPELQANADPGVAHLKVERAITVWAHYALARVSDDPAPHVQALAAMLANDDDAGYLYESRRSWTEEANRRRLTVRAAAAQALRNLGPVASAAVPDLAKMLREARSSVAYREAITALASIAPSAPETVTALSETIEAFGPHGPHFWGAHRALRDIGADAEGALPALLRELRRPYSDEEAAATLAAIGTTAVPGLTEALGAPRASSRYWAATALGEIGQEARPASSKLRELAQADPTHAVRRAAAEALAQIEG